MSYGNKQYREYALIQGINLLVNMVNQVKEEKISLQKIHDLWIESNVLAFKDQIELIFGTAADGTRCRYMVHCINQLNGYMMSKYPNHKGLIRNLTKDVLDSINMAIMGNANIWSRAQLNSINAAFMSGRQGRATPYFSKAQEEDNEELDHRERKKLDYNV